MICQHIFNFLKKMEATKMLKCAVVNATIGYPLVNHTYTTLPAQFEQTEIDFASEHFFKGALAFSLQMATF